MAGEKQATDCKALAFGARLSIVYEYGMPHGVVFFCYFVCLFVGLVGWLVGFVFLCLFASVVYLFARDFPRTCSFCFGLSVIFFVYILRTSIYVRSMEKITAVSCQSGPAFSTCFLFSQPQWIGSMDGLMD